MSLATVNLTDNVIVDEYQKLPQTGSFIVVDRVPNVIVGDRMISCLNTNGEARIGTYSEVDHRV